jgi:hypothetical protein
MVSGLAQVALRNKIYREEGFTNGWRSIISMAEKLFEEGGKKK